VTFGDASAVDTTASFSLAGSYVLRLTASDGAVTRSDQVTVTVQTASGGTVLTTELRVAASSDDAEQRLSGNMNLKSSDLELIQDNSSEQLVGIRFAGLQIPAGATITNAYVQFTTDEVSLDATSLSIRAQAVDNASTFTTSSGDIASRVWTTQDVAWSPPAWNTRGEAGLAQRTPNLAALVQAVVGRAGWAQGNAIALQVSGAGRRTAESFDGASGSAPLLHVDYTVG
jgi:hypothetical protein